MKVLVVDDDEFILNLLENVLRITGHEVFTAANGEEAWEILNRDSIRLVITDWHMPRMDGVELSKKIREATFSDYIYILLLAPYGKKEDILTGLSAGADDFIAKPFALAELNLRVEFVGKLLFLETRGVKIFNEAKQSESRDTRPGLHLERVRNYSKIIASILSTMDKYKGVITLDYIYNIYFTSSLHDIGKAGIPDRVLLKPGKLTEEEWAIMRSHTRKGAVILEMALKKFPEVAFLKMARDIARFHHEKYDGSGYPNGLEKKEIPLAGRIVALADVYDALTSDRVYKKALSPSEARSIIIENIGHHFDPDVVEAFLVAESSFMEVFYLLSRNVPAPNIKLNGLFI